MCVAGMCVAGSVDAQLHQNNLVHVHMYQLITFDTGKHMFIKMN